MAVGNILIISYPLLQVFNVFHFQPFFVLGVVVLCSRVLLVGWFVVVVLFWGGGWVVVVFAFGTVHLILYNIISSFTFVVLSQLFFNFCLYVLRFLCMLVCVFLCFGGG